MCMCQMSCRSPVIFLSFIKQLQLMTQCSLHRHSHANTTTDVAAYADLSPALLSFSVTPLNLLFPSVPFHFPFVPLISLCLMSIPFSFLPPLLTFPHSTVCAGLSLTYLFYFPSLYPVASSVSLRLSQQCPESKCSWLSSDCQPERKEKAACSQSGTLFLSLCAW